MDDEELMTPDLLPFQHKDIQHVQMNINLAKKFKDDGNNIAAVLICMNIADYLAEFIAMGLTMMGIEAMGKYYMGAVTYTPKRPKEFTIKDSMKVIRNYSFADKDKLLSILGKINQDRNHLAHKIVKSGTKSVPEVDKKINELFVLTDKLINVTNLMQTGFPPPNAIEKFQNQSPKEDN